MIIEKTMPKTVNYEYWACNVDEHRHKFKHVAQRCIDLGKPKKPRYEWTIAQLDDMQARRDAGETFKAIGLFYGRTGTRIKDLLQKWVRVQARRAQGYKTKWPKE